MKKLGNDFLWGVSTSAYQIEGGWKDDNKGISIWDTFLNNKKNNHSGDNGNIACDHYNKIEEDINTLKSLGINSYRFSFSWPRIIPKGTGDINKKGLEFYKKLLSLLKDNNIKPVATIYHWDLPQALEDIGGWNNRDIIDYFVNYSKILFENFGQDIYIWITQNEPRVTAYRGYGSDTMAPGLNDQTIVSNVAHNLLLSHGKTVQLYRKMGLLGKIGISLNLKPVYPKDENNSNDIFVANELNKFKNDFFIDPIIFGKYPEISNKYFLENIGYPKIEDGDMKIISSPIDFLGINYYSRDLVYFVDDNKWNYKNFHPEDSKYTDLNWEVYPKGIEDILLNINKKNKDIPIYITENGACYNDILEIDHVDDEERFNYIKSHIEHVYKAIDRGVNVKGYFLWSFMDNLEWSFGFSKRFGLVYVDFQTQKRYLKKSAHLFKKLIKNIKL